MEVYDLCREKLRIYRGFSTNRSQGNIGNLGSHKEVVLDHVMFFWAMLLRARSLWRAISD